MRIGELTAHLRLDSTQFNAALRRAESSLGAAASRIQRAGNQLSAVGSQLTRTVTLPIVGMGTAAVVAAAKWETAMVGVAKTVDASAAELEQLGREFVSLSEKIPVSSNELANLGATAGQLGIATENIRGFVEVMAALGVSTNLSAQDAATALARLANITQMPQTQFDRLGATVVALGNNLATTEAEIVEMGLRLAGAGAKVGLTEAQILALAGALSSVGVRAEAGGTALSRVMVEIASALEMGGEKAQRFADVAGLSTDRFARMFKEDAAEAVVTFIEGLGKLESQGKSTFGVLEDLALADVRVRDALLRASGAGDLFRRSLQLGSAAWEENTALTEEARKFYERLAGQFGILRNKLVNIAAEFGATLQPAIEDAIKFADKMLDRIRDAVEWFGKLDESTRKLAVGIAAIAAAAGPATIAIGGLTAAFGGLGVVAAATATSVTISTTAIVAGLKSLAVATAVVSGTALLVGAAFVSIGAAVFQLIKHWDGLVVSTKQAFAQIGAAVSSGIATATRAMANWARSIASVSGVLRSIPGLEVFGLVELGAEAALGTLERAADTAQRAADRTSALVDVYGRAFYAVSLLKDTAKEFGIPQEKLDGAIRGIRQLEDAVEQGRLSPEKFNQFLTTTEASFIAFGKRLQTEAEKTGAKVSESLAGTVGVGTAGAAVPAEVLAAYDEMQRQLSQLEVRAAAFGSTIDVPAERLAILRAGIDQFITLGRTMDDKLNTSGTRLRDLAGQFLALATDIDATSASLQRQAELQQFVNQMMAQIQTPAARYQQALLKIREAAEAGFVTTIQMAALAHKAFQDAVRAMQALGLSLEEIAARLGMTVEQVKAAMERVGTDIKGTLNDMKRDIRMIAVGVGQQLVMGIIQGVRDFGDLLKNIIISVISAAVSIGLRSALGIGSPSKLGIYAGEQVTLGVAVGIQDSARASIGMATDTLRATVARGLERTVRNIQPLMSDLAAIPKEIASAITQIAPALVDVGRLVPAGLSLDGAVRPAFAAAAPAVTPNLMPVSQTQTLRVDFSDMPKPLTPEAQAVDARWQRVLTETLRAVNKRGYRDG